MDPDPVAPGRARSAVIEAMPFIPLSRRYDVALVVSELVHNAITHGGADAGEITVEWAADRRSVELRVRDHGPGFPDPVERRLGLSLVERLTDRVSWSNDPTTVTCEVLLRAPRVRDWADADDESVLAAAALDPAARDEAVARYANLSQSLARRFRNRGISDEDLGQVAQLALLKAVSRFDADAGSFVAYAKRTISGELKRHLRDRAWAVRVPRSLQELSLEVGRASTDLTHRLGRRPSVDEIANEVGRPADEVIEALTAGGAYRADSLDRPTTEDDFSLLDTLGEADDNLRLAEQWHGIAPGIAELPERERRILYLRFYEDLTQSEIAERVGMSQMHVSRLLRNALTALRESTG